MAGPGDSTDSGGQAGPASGAGPDGGGQAASVSPAQGLDLADQGRSPSVVIAAPVPGPVGHVSIAAREVPAEVQAAVDARYDVVAQGKYEDLRMSSPMWKQIAKQEAKSAAVEGRQQAQEDVSVGTVIGVSTAASAGYFIWCIKSGSLITSWMAAWPAWRVLDPLPVLGFGEARSRRKKRGAKGGEKTQPEAQPAGELDDWVD